VYCPIFRRTAKKKNKKKRIKEEENRCFHRDFLHYQFVSERGAGQEEQAKGNAVAIFTFNGVGCSHETSSGFPSVQ